MGFFTGALRYKVDWDWPSTPDSYQTANGANGYGLYDMAGNVSEWCNDWYGSSYYSSSPYINPHGPTSGTDRVLRGGCWSDYANGCRCAMRAYYSPEYPYRNDGFRLVLAQPTLIPEAPSEPDPADLAQNVSIDTDLNWADASGATSYDVYFGTANPPPFVDNTVVSNWPLDTLAYDTTYYWQVVAKNDAGATAGPVWQFTTEAQVPPGMVLIPAGEFMMGNCMNPSEGFPAEQPVHAVYVNAFYMNLYEVTNQQYCDALNWAWAQGNLITVAGGVVYQYGSGTSYCDTTTSYLYSGITWNGSSFGVVSGKENHPMVMVTWYGAAAYCNWRSAMQGKPLCYDLSTWTCNFGSGYRLPTEAEWEKAARGGTPGHRFPWSDQDTIQHARCNYYSYWNGGVPVYPYDTNPTSGYHPCWGVGSYPYTSPVGFFDGSLRYKADFNWPGSPTSYQTASGANGYGLYDMAGNVWEWCNDWSSSSYYSSSPYNNPTGPTSGTYRVLRGGGWLINALRCRVASRSDNLPGYRYDDGGFRLVLDFP